MSGKGGERVERVGNVWEWWEMVRIGWEWCGMGGIKLVSKVPESK